MVEKLGPFAIIRRWRVWKLPSLLNTARVSWTDKVGVYLRGEVLVVPIKISLFVSMRQLRSFHIIGNLKTPARDFSCFEGAMNRQHLMNVTCHQSGWSLLRCFSSLLSRSPTLARAMYHGESIVPS